MKILIINPGGTSTKIAVFEDNQELFKASIDHTAEELKPYPHVFDEFEYRKNLIVKTVEEAGYSISDFGCVAGRGGLCRPVEGGTYAVNDRMIEDFRNAVCGEHASNLGAVIAKSIGDEIGVPSFIVDPVAVDEMMDKARITGLAELERPAWFHALNHKAVARSIAGKRTATSSLPTWDPEFPSVPTRRERWWMVPAAVPTVRSLRSAAVLCRPIRWFSSAIPGSTRNPKW